jgi:poly(3-hydroxybutyrate) depolymerase
MDSTYSSDQFPSGPDLYTAYEWGMAFAGVVHAWAVAAETFTNLWADHHPLPGVRKTLGKAEGEAARIRCLTKTYEKLPWGIDATEIDGKKHSVAQASVWKRPFCSLEFFSCPDRPPVEKDRRLAGKVLLVAPLSGHFATLLRPTVKTMLPDTDVYVTDWQNARDVPLSEGDFGFDDYVNYLESMMEKLGDTHIVSVCQSTVPVTAAVARIATRGGRQPLTITFINGPDDTRLEPTKVNDLAQSKGLAWFKRNVIHKVPQRFKGRGRAVYPGFLQRAGFVGMNQERHDKAHREYSEAVAKGDKDSAEKHRGFYDEFYAVLDLTAKFYLETVDYVFIRHLLPRGLLKVRGELVEPAAITRPALVTVACKKDDIVSVPQAEAVLDLCTGVPENRKKRILGSGGHYFGFAGKGFTQKIWPEIWKTIKENDPGLKVGNDNSPRTNIVAHIRQGIRQPRILATA